jgi:predicted MPP superfamily phosphohydrolase
MIVGFSREAGFLVFRILLPLLVVGTQFILFRRTERWFNTQAPGAKNLRMLVRILFLLFNAAFLYAFWERPSYRHPVPWLVQFGTYPFYFWHGAGIFIGVALLISKIVKSPFQIGLWVARKVSPTREKIQKITSTTSYQAFDASRRTFLRRGMYGLTVASFSGTAYGMLLEKNECDLTTAEFSLPHLPEQLEGFTIALVSDIHSSIFMSKEEMERYAQMVNSLDADLIVVPGDFVTANYNEVYPFVEAFNILRAPYGVFGVLGNHDFYSGADAVAKEVDACGIKLLRNDKIIVDKDGGRFYLIGVDDVGFSNRGPIKLDEAIGHAPLELPRILLSHRPYYLEQAAGKDIDLVLSGHTHGGQVVLGRFGNMVIAPSQLVSKYVWGKYREGNTHMYVSRGIGTVGLPIRINCPPEITKITLRKGNA